MVEKNENEWRALIESLTAGSQAEPLQEDVAPMFADPKARQRVGDVITKAILGVPLYAANRPDSPDSGWPSGGLPARFSGEIPPLVRRAAMAWAQPTTW
jgi:hypothetical protein